MKMILRVNKKCQSALTANRAWNGWIGAVRINTKTRLYHFESIGWETAWFNRDIYSDYFSDPSRAWKLNIQISQIMREPFH